MPFVQRIEGHEYILFAVYQHTLEDTYLMKGADVYSRSGDKKGFWPVSNMPDWLPEKLDAYARRMRLAGTFSRVIRDENDLA